MATDWHKKKVAQFRTDTISLHAAICASPLAPPPVVIATKMHTFVPVQNFNQICSAVLEEMCRTQTWQTANFISSHYHGETIIQLLTHAILNVTFIGNEFASQLQTVRSETFNRDKCSRMHRTVQSRSMSILMTAYDEWIVVSVTPDSICSVFCSHRFSSQLR